MEYKMLNIVSHFVFMILVLAGVTVFYFAYAETLPSSLYIMGAIGIGVLFLILSTVLMLIADCVHENHEIISAMLRTLALIFSVASIAAVAVFFHMNISVFSDGVEYWVIALFGFCSVIQSNYRRINTSAIKANSGILVAFSPVIGLVIAMLFCGGAYFLTGWIVTLREFDTQIICMLYFWISVGSVLLFNVIVGVVVMVLKLVFGSV